MPDILRPGIVKAGNAGLVATTTGNDLLHTLPIASTVNVTAPRSAVITKVMVYNNTGANVTLQLGTLNRNPAGAAFVQLIPTILAINGIDTEWAEADLPAVEFISWPQLTAAGRTGDIYVVGSAIGVQVIIEVREFGV